MNHGSSIVIALLLILAACGTTRQQKKRAKQDASVRIDVEIIARDVLNDVQNVARHITNLTEDRELQRQMVVWQINTLAYCRRALLRPDPRFAFVDIWTLLKLTRQYAYDERGKKLLGPQQDFAVKTLDGMIERLERRARSILTQQQFTDVSSAIDVYVKDSIEEGDEIAQPPSSRRGQGSAFDIILAVPEGIFSLGGGVKDTAVSISEVARATEQGVVAVSDLPQTIRWQAELLLFSMEENESIRKLLADFSRTSEAMAKVGNTAETLPARIEKTSLAVLDKAKETQPEFRQTLEEGRRVVEETRAAFADVEPLLEKAKENGAWIETASGRVTEAGQAWDGAFEQLNLLVHPPLDPNLPPPEPSPPFDFKDVVKTAEEANRTAEHVRAAVVDLRAVVEGETGDRVESIAGATIDRLTTFAVTVILTFFGALLAYRLVVVFVTRSRTATP